MDGTRGGFFRHGLMASAAIVCVATATPAVAQTRSFNVPEQDAASGVAAFAKQADIQLLISARDANGKRTNTVRGNLTVEQGLQKLLADTGLRAQSTGAQTYSVVPSTVGNGPAAAEAASLGDDAAPESQAGISEILVVGSRSQNVDIKRSEDGTQPYVILSQEDIRKSGATSVDDFLRTRLPQNTQRTRADQVETTSDAGSIVRGGNNGRIDLRGLGTNQTLILVDGRRIPGVGGIALGQANISGIPLSAIDRIEVLPSTAGAIYGGSAVGGVVNIILRRDYSGIEAQLQYGNTFDGATGDFRASLSGGFSIGSTRISFNGTRDRTSDLLRSDRTKLVERSRELALKNNPNIYEMVQPLGATPNICASIATGSGRCNGAQLVFDNGTPLGSSHTFVPIGYLGPVATGDGGAALAANAGHYNFEEAEDGDTFLQGDRRDAFNVNVRRSIGKSFDLFADFSWSSERSSYNIATGISTLLQANNPNNPFLQPIRVTFPTTVLNSEGSNKSKSIAAVGGAIIKLGDGWSMSLEQGWSRSRNYSEVSSRFSNAAVRTLAQPVATSDVNIVPEHDYASVATTSSLINGPINTRLLTTSARLGGSPFELPGGPVTLSMLAERRSEKIKDFLQLSEASDDVPAFGWTPSRWQNAHSLYVEGQVPLFSSANARPLVQSLELQGSLRYDRYSTSTVTEVFFLPSIDAPRPDLDYVTNHIHSLDYLLGVRYAPFDGIVLRGSYSTGFLPPALNQLLGSLAPPQPASFFPIPDPKRGGELLIGDSSGRITTRRGGNVDLEPEQSKSLSLGIILEPPQLPGVRFTADYTKIRKKGEIRTIGSQDLVNIEDDFPDRVTRGANLPGDPPGFAGPIIGLDLTLINVADTNVDAWDFQFDYDLKTDRLGKFHAYAIATRQTTLETRLVADGPLTTTLGFANGPLKWRGNVGLDWDLGLWSASWNMQYYGGYFVCGSTDSMNSCNTTKLNQGSDRVRRQTYHDIYLKYAFNQPSFMAGTEVALGINNAFKAYPPAIAQASGRGVIYSPYGDPRLRRFVLTLRKRFGN